MTTQNINFKGFIIPRDEKHAEWLKLGKEIGEIKSPVLNPVLAEQLAQVARMVNNCFGSGILFLKVRDDEIEIEFKQISVSTSTNTSTTNSNNVSHNSRVEVIKVTRENRPSILRQLAQEGWRVVFRNTEIGIEDTGYCVGDKTFSTLNSAVKYILDSSGKNTSQVNAWDAVRLIKGDRVAKLEL